MSIEGDVRDECDKLIKRFERYARELREEDNRRKTRTGVAKAGLIRRPSYWGVDNLFNPYKVRASAESISRAIRLGLANGDYRPYNSVLYEVPKSDGTHRAISVFNIPDAAVSRRIYRSLLAKNKPRMSSYSYAYRDDLTVHDAIHHIASDFTGHRRMFIAEYDFSKYFDSIDHDYIWHIIDEKKFFINSRERQVLNAFMRTTPQSQNGYSRMSDIVEPQKRGIPQGTSISLFLANIAAWELDRALERLGVGFARYADDTLIWSADYSRICDAVGTLADLGREMGVSINLEKSHGISIFTPDGSPAEMAPKSSVEFVGYSFSHNKTGMRKSVVTRIKQRLAYLIWSNLLEPLERGYFIPDRLQPGIDLDYLIMILQIRRYLYGNLTEERIARLRSGEVARLNYPGVMSFFPSVDDIDQLKGLDGWLLHTVHTSLARRGRLLHELGVPALPTPHGLSREALLRASGEKPTGEAASLRLPSFVRMGTLIKAAAEAHGPNTIGRTGGPQHYQYAG